MHREIATNRNRYCRSEERPESRSSLQIVVVTWFPESRKSRLQLVEIHIASVWLRLGKFSVMLGEKTNEVLSQYFEDTLDKGGGVGPIP